MSLEIERKWRLNALPDGLPDGTALRQGYLSQGGGTEVRLRDKGGQARLTVKQGKGLSRTEVEIDLSREQFDALWPLTRGARIEKRRCVVALGELCAEVDIFEGALAGLLLVEVEFPDEHQARAFVAPPWFGAELTGQAGWSNGDLARAGLPQGGQP